MTGCFVIGYVPHSELMHTCNSGLTRSSKTRIFSKRKGISNLTFVYTMCVLYVGHFIQYMLRFQTLVEQIKGCRILP